MWELNPTLCHNVTVRNVTIDSHGPNNDGVDPDACRDVLIEKCTFSTGDDCIAIKAGRNQDGRRVNVPCENIIVQECAMQDGHGGVSIGSEVSGGIRNVFVERCKMSSPHLQRALRIKTNSYRGGVIENIHFSNVTVGQVAESVIEVDFYYEEGEGGPFKPGGQGHFRQRRDLPEEQVRNLLTRICERADQRSHAIALHIQQCREGRFLSACGRRECAAMSW